MSKLQSGLVLASVIVVVVVIMDILFFRHHTVARLMANVGVVIIVGAFYLRFFKKN